MGSERVGIGLIGAGTVGGGVVRILKEKAALLEARIGVQMELLHAADLEPNRLRDLGVPDECVTTDYREVLANDDVQVVVELVGGTSVAYEIVKEALEAGKGVVTANKALLAERGGPLFALAKEKGLPLMFEAAVCGAIPIIQAVRDGLVANRMSGLLGIVNGTCNYILTEMLENESPYDDALADAQKLGFAEADPTFDVEGNDSAHKLALLSALGFETVPEYQSIPVEGISRLRLEDVRLAAELGYVVKLLAVARAQEETVFLSVHPALLPASHPLASVSGSMNAVAIKTDAAGEVMFYGPGAGEMPTASAVVSDIAAVAQALSAGGRPRFWGPGDENTYDHGEFDDYTCAYFLRFDVQDRFGVLGRIATILGEHNVSIDSMIQHGEAVGAVPIVLCTHEAREGDVRAAVKRIEDEEFVVGEAGVLRVEQ
jgi:homoserine dehydrogenase